MNLPVNHPFDFSFLALIENRLVFSEDIRRFIAAVSFIRAIAQFSNLSLMSISTLANDAVETKLQFDPARI
jgi:hypothetical protein